MAQPELIKDIEARVKIPGDEMTGNLSIRKKSYPQFFLISNDANRYTVDELSDQGTYIISNRNYDESNGLNGVYLYIKNEQESSNNLLTLGRNKNGIYDEFTILHTGNISLVDNRFVLKSGDTMAGSLIINATDSGLQPSLLKVVSTNLANTSGSWIGRAIIGAKDLTFLMGVYNGLAGIGAHSWTDAINGSGAAWAPIYFNPDGAAPMYFGANGGGWTANTGTFIVQGSTTAGLGTITSNGISYLNNKVFIGNQIGNNELIINGAFSNTDLGLQDGNDRPSLKILGYYPQIVLMAGGANNTNHGPTISLGSYDSGTTGSFKTFTIGTQGVNSTRLDIGFGTASNPHLNCMNDFNGNPIMRLHSDRTVTHYGPVIIDNRSLYNNFNEGLRINYSANSCAGIVLGGEIGTTVGCTNGWFIANLAGTLYTSWAGSSDATYRTQFENSGHFRIYGLPGDGNPILEVNAQSSPGLWNYAIAMRNPNMAVGTNFYMPIGVAYNTRNMIGPEFYYAGSGSESNFLGIEVYGAGNAMRWYANLDTYAYGKLYGAVWNDYAEFRSSDPIEPGRVICETGDGTLKLSAERLQPGANVVSDTFGFAIGETENCKTPIAVSGRVLVYTYEDRYNYEAGDPVCAAPGGTVSKMSREEVMMYPDRIVGTVSEIPEYERWGTGNVEVKNRIWIKVK